MRRILIVDDAGFMRFSLKSLLESNGFEVVGEAQNGLVGVEKYKALRPDIVTMDISMPEMDGIAALKAIKLMDPSAKVIMISAMGKEHAMREALGYGAKAFIMKPFKANNVLETLILV